jgi:hypothetical protein
MSEDFYSASSRHWDHSQFLGDHGRWQEAAYLAGYAAECALKALVEQGGLMGRPFGHSLVQLTGEGLEMALLLNPLLRRYPVEPIATGLPGLGHWSEAHRYEETGFLPEADFRQMVTEAHRVVEWILVRLTLDGQREEIPL